MEQCWELARLYYLLEKTNRILKFILEKIAGRFW